MPDWRLPHEPESEHQRVTLREYSEEAYHNNVDIWPLVATGADNIKKLP